MSSSPRTVRMGPDRARRIALVAQGLGDPRPGGGVDIRHARRVLRRVQLLQIDSVNVLCRSQELPLFARLGPHRRDLVPRLTERGELFEYWGHEASHLPVDLQPFLRWRMDDAREGVNVWGSIARVGLERPDLVDRVLRQVREEGPITAGEIDRPGERGSGMWARTPGKAAMEFLFWTGRVSARRSDTFERVYDLTERLLPAHVLERPTPTRREAQKELLLVAARGHGVGTADDLADYFRLGRRDARLLLDELVDEERLVRAEVRGWTRPAYLHPEARGARRIGGAALLSPFDSLVWERDRTERIFGFRYRLEIYTPRHRRVHGYYVLPFLLDGDLVARVDLKADRARGVLLVRAAHGEEGIERDRVVHELGAELDELATFLGLDGVEVEADGRGDLAPALAAERGRVTG